MHENSNSTREIASRLGFWSAVMTALLFNLNAYNFTAVMHRVVIMGAILSVLMALLSLTGFNSKKIGYSYIKKKISIEVIEEKISKLGK
jgi:hypothetical protein